MTLFFIELSEDNVLLQRRFNSEFRIPMINEEVVLHLKRFKVVSVLTDIDNNRIQVYLLQNS